MSDLISRKAVINLINEYFSEIDISDVEDFAICSNEDLKERIENLPSNYDVDEVTISKTETVDVDKVIKQLEELKQMSDDYMNKEDCKDYSYELGKWSAYDRAVNIVKAGGIE